MNGVFDRQTSGNDWTPLIKPMLHERSQDSVPEVSHRRISVLDDLELQMQRYEADYVEMLAEVGRRFVMPSDRSVYSFLNSHRTLPQLLIEAVPHLRDTFGDLIFALRITSDEYSSQHLYVDALWHGDPMEAYEATDRFEDKWWIANSRIAGGYLTFTYRLV